MKLKFGKDITTKKVLPGFSGNGSKTVENSKQINDIQDSTRKFNKKIALFILTIVFIGSGSLVIFYFYYDKDSTNETQGTVLTPKDEIIEQINKEKDPVKKSQLYNSLSNAELIENDKQAAQEAARNAVNTNKSVASYATLAGAAELNQDWATAAEYYQKAAELSEPVDDPDINNDYNHYNMKAKEMKDKL